MSDEVKVTATRDDGEKQQWGHNWLYFRDGVKWTLKTKVIAILFILVFVAGSTLQVATEEPRAAWVGKAKSGIPLDTGSGQTVALEKYTPAAGPKAGRPAGRGTPGQRRRLTGPQVVPRPRNVNVPPGAIAKARLVSGASNGLVRAELAETVRSNGETLFEEGTVLVGSGSSTEERLLVVFNQAVFRDGTVAPIQAQACDVSDKIVGLKGSKLGNKAVNIAGSIGLGFLGGFSEGLQDTHGQQGAVVRPPTLKNALLNATATTALEQSKNLMSDLKEKRPVIEVPAGQEICVIFGGGM